MLLLRGVQDALPAVLAVQKEKEQLLGVEHISELQIVNVQGRFLVAPK